MICKTLEQLALGNALGTLTAEEQAQFERLMAAYPTQKAEAAAYIDTAAMMALAASPPVSPPSHLKARVLANLPKQDGPAPLAKDAASHPKTLGAWLKSRYFGLLRPLLSLPDDVKAQLEGAGKEPEFVDPEELPWNHTGVPGLRKKLLRDDEHLRVEILRLDAGASIPPHDHSGIEAVYVLSGHLQTQGRLLAPGDFMHFAHGSSHDEAFSVDGCHAMVINCKPPPPPKAASLQTA
jgi:quercetin dioxygenase-like cupin family protein